MSELGDYPEYPYLSSLGEKREELGLPELKIDLLTAQSASQDPKVAGEAKRQLKIKWDASPERDTALAPTVDLMEQISQYPEAEALMMTKGLVGIQLTEGCNGDCPFCLFGKKKGVTAKFSYDSVVTFLKNYHSELPERRISLYWDSDPFDYRDGKRSFVDVYKVWKDLDPRGTQYVSTAIPRGSEKNFIEFMRFLIKEQAEPEHGQTTVRISLARHNVQRVEATVSKLIERLHEDGYSKVQINTFLYDHVVTEGRFDKGVSLVGPLIHKSDDIKDIETPACRDGVLITPKSCRAIMMTTPTVYEPSGQKDVLLTPGGAERKIPRYVDVKDFQDFSYRDTLDHRSCKEYAMLPPIETASGTPYEMDNETDNITLKLGRETAAIGGLITDLALLTYRETVQSRSNKAKMKFATEGAAAFRERRSITEKEIRRAKDALEKGELTPSEREKLDFYVLLTETYLAEMDFLADQISAGRDITTISAIATALRQIGRDQVAELPNIIQGLLDLDKEVSAPSRRSAKVVRAQLMEAVGRHFGLGKISPNRFPFWYRGLLEAYVPKKRRRRIFRRGKRTLIR